MKAKIINSWTRRVAGGAGRCIFVVLCVCNYPNNFDALSWGAHKALRCKDKRCGLFIGKATLRVAPTRKEAVGR